MYIYISLYMYVLHVTCIPFFAFLPGRWSHFVAQPGLAIAGSFTKMANSCDARRRELLWWHGHLGCSWWCHLVRWCGESIISVVGGHLSHGHQWTSPSWPSVPTSPSSPFQGGCGVAERLVLVVGALRSLAKDRAVTLSPVVCPETRCLQLSKRKINLEQAHINQHKGTVCLSGYVSMVFIFKNTLPEWKNILSA